MHRYLLFAALAVGIGYAFWDLGQRGARAYERMLSQRIMNGLDVLGYSWARVEADGLKLELHGHAPDTFARDLAFESAKATAPMAEIANFATSTLAPPERREPVRVELHRDQRGVTMTGQTASRAMRNQLNAELNFALAELPVHDLTGIQAALPKQRINAEIKIASLAATRLPNAYVVMEPGSVTIEGQARDEADKEELIGTLLELAVDKVALDLRIRIPADVIAPFAFSAYKDVGGQVRVERCAIRSTEERQRLSTKLRVRNVEARESPCKVGLGGPGGDWPAAINAAIDALDSLGAGRVDLEYRHARLLAYSPTSPTDFQDIAERFKTSLPEGFEGDAELRNDDIATRTGIARESYWMHIARSDEGVTIAGQMPDDASRSALETYAAALFGGDYVSSSIKVVAASPPQDWQVASLRMLDYLSIASRGEIDLAGFRIDVRAVVDQPQLARAIHDDLNDLFPSFRIGTSVVVDLPARMEEIPLPGPRCADRLNWANYEGPIDFGSGSAKISKESIATLDTLAKILSRCTAKKIEIGGHTDAQGSDQVNQRISQARAESVVAALVRRGIPQDVLAAKGYGETLPIADNSTPEGRARNRRIEFLPVE